MLRFLAAASAVALTLGVAPATAAPEEAAYLVRFEKTLTDAQRLQLRAMGAKVGAYLAEQGYVVRTANKSSLQRLAYVDLVTPYAAVVDAPMTLTGPSPFLIVLVNQDATAQQKVARKITAIGGKVDNISTSREHIAAILDQGQAAQVARLPEVLALSAVSAPETDMAIARESSGANYIESVAGYRGQGVRGEVMDSGLRTTHQEYRARPAVIHNGNGSSTSHGTSTYGQIFASGVSGPHRGLLPEAQGIFAVYNNPDRYGHTKQLVDAAGQYRAVFQTNSWGSGLTKTYTAVSAEMDRIVFDHDILICQSQSNDGDQDSRPQAWAKNVLSVGGQYHFNTVSRADDKWNRGASIGPAADGRIKPDVSNYYDRIDTVSSTSDTSYTPSFGGTSGATPITCGNTGLMFQMWADGVFDGGTGKKRDVFASRPHAATAKALLINTAEQFAFSGAAHDLTRTHQGWGTVSVRNAYDAAKAGGFKLPILVNETDVLTNGQSRKYTYTSTGKPMKATLVYTDPAGSPTAPRARVNDLTLKVTAPDGTVYYGNNGLNVGNFSTPGGLPNTVDNVENVFLQAPAAGAWTVEVIASQINADGHRETTATDADYALVVQ